MSDLRVVSFIFVVGCSVDHTGLLPNDAAPPRDTSSRDPADASPPTDAADPNDASVSRDVPALPDVPAPPDIPRCSPDGTTCTEGILRVCTGREFTRVSPCTLGCHEEEPRCQEMAVSNVSDEHLGVGSANITAAGGESLLFDTETGEITRDGNLVRAAGEDVLDGVRFERIEQDGRPGVGVFSVGGLEVADGGAMSARGSAGLVLLSAGAVVIDGEVDLGGNGREGGPGGGRGGQDGDGSGAGAGGHQRSVTDAGGGGGGGHAARGGEGGSESVMDGAPGAAIDDPLGVPLVGGGGGGGGGRSNGANGGTGGGGGGAIQISSAVSIVVNGVIRVPGSGGDEGNRAGGGGGAGGTILLEAPDVELSGRAVANGGSGAAGRGGEDGTRGTDNVSQTSGAGGDGGGGDLPTGLDGADDPDNGENDNGAAGGGGAAGRVIIRGRRRMIRGAISPTFGNGSSELDVEER